MYEVILVSAQLDHNIRLSGSIEDAMTAMGLATSKQTGKHCHPMNHIRPDIALTVEVLGWFP